MGLIDGLFKTATGAIKTGLGVAIDISTLSANAIEDETYTEKGLRDLKEGIDKIFE